MLGGKIIGVIGAGNIGEALIKGILKAHLVEPSQIIASRKKKEPLIMLKEELKINVTFDNEYLIKNSDIIINCIKPQIVRDFLKEFSSFFKEEKLIISVAAGITTSTIESIVEGGIPVVRVMPNIAALSGEAITPYCLGKFATDSHAIITSEIFSSIGVTVKVEEDMMDPITAVSGTGPAYIFYFLEALIDASIAVGLPPNFSRALLRQTLWGSAKLYIETGKPPETLRAWVTSPQGTTYYATKYLDSKKTKDLIIEAVKVARKRAEELGKLS